jgi:hypothetical protein
MSVAILNVLSDGPMFHREMVDIGLPKIFVDIQTGKLLREGKIQRNARGQYHLPIPPPANEALVDLKLKAKGIVRPTPDTTHLTCRVCNEARELKYFTRDQYPHPLHPTHKPRCGRCKYRATTEGKRVKAMGLARW